MEQKNHPILNFLLLAVLMAALLVAHHITSVPAILP